MSAYSMIVVGGGIAGLSAALAWNSVRPPGSGKVLVLERNPVVGGCVSSFARSGYKFDTVQILPDVSELLEFFGVDLPMRRFEPYYARLFLADPETKRAKEIRVPSSLEGFRDMLHARYPAERRRVEAFFRRCSAMHEELRHLKTEPSPAQALGILLRCPRVIAASPLTYHRFLHGFGIAGGELFEVLDLFSSFAGLSGDRCAALLTTSAMMTTLEGAWRPAAEFVRLPLAMRDRLVQAGGEVRTGTAVARILAEDGRAKGVTLADGEVLESELVVATADTKAIAEGLVGSETLRRLGPGYERKIRKAAMSPSSFTVHLGLDDGFDLEGLGFDCGYNVLTTGKGAHARMFEAWDRGELMTSETCFHLAAYSPSAARGGKKTLVIHVVPAAMGDWAAMRDRDIGRYRSEKERLADFYVRKVEEYMAPGLSRHVVLRDVATPATYARYIGSPTGSNFDMLPVPGNFGATRLRARSPLRGLFIPKFSHGIWPSMQAGLQVADMASGGALMAGNARYTKPLGLP
jgi:all-trans-retinol 13,14-reductase